MKAIVCDRYGPPDVLRLEEVERPVPRDNQVLVKVYASSLNAADFEILGSKRSASTCDLLGREILRPTFHQDPDHSGLPDSLQDVPLVGETRVEMLGHTERTSLAAVPRGVVYVPVLPADQEPDHGGQRVHVGPRPDR